MHLVTAQALYLAGISKETLRHWKKVLPPLRDRDGRSRQYTLAEVAAMKVIAEADRQLGLPVSAFAGQASTLFEQIGNFLALDGPPMAVCLTRNELTFAPAQDLPKAEVVAIIQLRPLLQRLYHDLNAGVTQYDLFQPPHASPRTPDQSPA